MKRSADGPTRFRVVPQEEGMPLPQLLARRLPQISIDAARDLVKAGSVYVGHLRVRMPTVRVVPGERITVYLEGIEHSPLRSSDVRIVYRDEYCVVVDKAAGVPVAATKQSARGTVSEGLRRILEREGSLRPYVGVVHRLDRDASGLVLFTIRTIANKSIHGQFVNHTIERTYRVLMVGDTESQVCTLPLVHTRTGARVGVSGEPGSREAATRFRRLAALAPQPGTTLMEVSLETGRRHQIRVHAQALGHPILGDRTYGSCAGPGLHLHAWRLGFEHPLERGRIVLVHSELPEWARSTDCDSKPT